MRPRRLLMGLNHGHASRTLHSLNRPARYWSGTGQPLQLGSASRAQDPEQLLELSLSLFEATERLGGDHVGRHALGIERSPYVGDEGRELACFGRPGLIRSVLDDFAESRFERHDAGTSDRPGAASFGAVSRQQQPGQQILAQPSGSPPWQRRMRCPRRADAHADGCRPRDGDEHGSDQHRGKQPPKPGGRSGRGVRVHGRLGSRGGRRRRRRRGRRRRRRPDDRRPGDRRRFRLGLRRRRGCGRGGADVCGVVETGESGAVDEVGLVVVAASVGVVATGGVRVRAGVVIVALLVRLASPDTVGSVRLPSASAHPATSIADMTVSSAGEAGRARSRVSTMSADPRVTATRAPSP